MSFDEREARERRPVGPRPKSGLREEKRASVRSSGNHPPGPVPPRGEGENVLTAPKIRTYTLESF